MTEPTMSPIVETRLRNADLPTLIELLKAQNDVKYDVVVPAAKLCAVGGLLGVEDGAVRWDDEGAQPDTAWLAPTDIFDDGLSDRLSIPRAYLRRLRQDRLDLYDANVNGWLRGDLHGGVDEGLLDPRTFLVRAFRTDDPDAIGIARSIQSDRYKALDNYDAVLSVLDGIRSAGVECNVIGGDLSERRMLIKVNAPNVTVEATELLKGYRSPFDNAEPERMAALRAHGYIEPKDRIVTAGFEFGNSETGGGAWTITPRFVVPMCTNGWKITLDAMREVHLGGKLDEGIVRWSAETQHKALELIKAKTIDAVQTFLSVEYVSATVARLSEKAGAKVKEPSKTIERLAKAQSWSESEADSILAHFLMGGQMTAGGIVQAVTSVAQTVESPDRAYDLETQAVALLDAAMN